MMDSHWGWGGGALFGSLSMIAVPVVFILAVVYFLHRLGPTARHSDAAPPSKKEREPSPMDILNARFAKGEIDAEEYRERKRILSE